MNAHSFPLKKIQEVLQNMHPRVDGWLLYDFCGNNNLALEILKIPSNAHLTRRFYYWIPTEGNPIKIVHYIEPHVVDHLPGKESVYSSWQELDNHLLHAIGSSSTIAMEYSHFCELPKLSKVDAGTVEWLNSKKIEITSSWPILEHFVSRWDEEEIRLHIEAAQCLTLAFKTAWKAIKDALLSSTPISELDVQRIILAVFAENDCITAHPPICAVGEHSALPHYSPTDITNKSIQKGDWILIDAWCKRNLPRAPYADFTEVAFARETPTNEMQKMFLTVKAAQVAAINFLKKKLSSKQEIYGFEVDDETRRVIQKEGFERFFIHRTGHNIHTELHGNGPNFDNYETRDTRRIVPRTCYSIEPGIYLPGMIGIRIECNVIIKEDLTIQVTGESADTLPCLLA